MVLLQDGGRDMSKKIKWIDKRGSKKKTIAAGVGIGALTMFALFVAGILPTIAGYLFTVMAYIWWMLGIAFSAIAGWFLASSDEPIERSIWALVLIVFIVLILYWAGVSLIANWWIIAIVAIFFIAVSILAASIGLKKRRSRS